MTLAHEISVDFHGNVFVYLFIKMKTLLLHLCAEERCVITAKNQIISFKEETRMSNFYHDCYTGGALPGHVVEVEKNI